MVCRFSGFGCCGWEYFFLGGGSRLAENLDKVVVGYGFRVPGYVHGFRVPGYVYGFRVPALGFRG